MYGVRLIPDFQNSVMVSKLIFFGLRHSSDDRTNDRRHGPLCSTLFMTFVSHITLPRDEFRHSSDDLPDGQRHGHSSDDRMNTLWKFGHRSDYRTNMLRGFRHSSDDGTNLCREIEALFRRRNEHTSGGYDTLQMTGRTCVGRLRHSSEDGTNVHREVTTLFR